MCTHRSEVNVTKLLDDLASMYTYDTSEVVLTELIANALDAGATCIRIDYDPTKRLLKVQDNGKGMTEEQFTKYHDIAADLKDRGDGIGFAGLGAKISFKISEKVVTSTRSQSFERSSVWYLVEGGALYWDELQESNLPGTATGTQVEVFFRDDANVTYGCHEKLVSVIRGKYLPLIVPEFLELYEQINRYSTKLRFVVNGEPLEPRSLEHEMQLSDVKREVVNDSKHGRIGYAVFGVAKEEYPMSTSLCGVLISVMGLVVKADMFNKFPREKGPHIFGLVEVPKLANYLTTAKTDFKLDKEGRRIYSAIGNCFSKWLDELGIQTTIVDDSSSEVRALQRELAKLAESEEVLQEFVGCTGLTTKGQVLTASEDGAIPAEVTNSGSVTFPSEEGAGSRYPAPMEPGEGTGDALDASREGSVRSNPIGRKSRRNPKVYFVERVDDCRLAWRDNGIAINIGHPAFRKVTNPTARRLLQLVSVSQAIQRFLHEDGRPDLQFTDRLLEKWAHI